MMSQLVRENKTTVFLCRPMAIWKESYEFLANLAIGNILMDIHTRESYCEQLIFAKALTILVLDFLFEKIKLTIKKDFYNYIDFGGCCYEISFPERLSVWCCMLCLSD